MHKVLRHTVVLAVTILATGSLRLGVGASPANAGPTHALPARTVVGGTEADIAAFPWLAAIGVPALPLRPSGQFCAGALIAPDQVLTAGHCAVFATAAPSMLSVTFGRADLTHTTGTTVAVREVHLDPAFGPTLFRDTMGFHDDTALLVLSSPVSLPPVRLGTLASTTPAPGTATVVGWGATSEDDLTNSRLRSATVPLVPDAACSGAYGSAFDATVEFCAGDTTADTGLFDSGGPVLADGRLIGVTSWAEGTAAPGFPGIYARPPAALLPRP